MNEAPQTALQRFMAGVRTDFEYSQDTLKNWCLSLQHDPLAAFDYGSSAIRAAAFVKRGGQVIELYEELKSGCTEDFDETAALKALGDLITNWQAEVMRRAGTEAIGTSRVGNEAASADLAIKAKMVASWSSKFAG